VPIEEEEGRVKYISPEQLLDEFIYDKHALCSL
jgi:hypothetical protein